MVMTPPLLLWLTLTNSKTRRLVWGTLPLLGPHCTALAVHSFSPALPPSEAALLKVGPPSQDELSTWEKRDGGGKEAGQ